MHDQTSRYRVNNVRYRLRNREFIVTYLQSHPCVDCGESDTTVLEFDHVGDKTANVADLRHRIAPLAVLEAEIAQCVVRCANCHRRRTARQFGWTR